MEGYKLKKEEKDGIRYYIYEKSDLTSETLKSAIEVLQEALKDEGYYLSWQANIAMAFKDEYNRQEYKNDHDKLEGFQAELDIHEIANTAAENFLQMLMKQ